VALTSAEPRGDELCARVEHYYFVFAVRHPTRLPPQETDLAAFIHAVAEYWVEE
jgi:hypothetical protein